jgi:hypothetical protein
MPRETELEMVARHVRDGERHVARQREIIAELTSRGASTEQATDLLMQFEDTLLQHRRHLARLEKAEPPPG